MKPGKHFNDRGLPAGKGWDEIPFPAVDDENAYAMEISGNSLEPAYRDGAVIIVSPAASVRKNDRVVVKTREGELLVKELKRKSAKLIELRAINPQHAERRLKARDVLWIARIVWASQ